MFQIIPVPTMNTDVITIVTLVISTLVYWGKDISLFIVYSFVVWSGMLKISVSVSSHAQYKKRLNIRRLYFASCRTPGKVWQVSILRCLPGMCDFMDRYSSSIRSRHTDESASGERFLICEKMKILMWLMCYCEIHIVGIQFSIAKVYWSCLMTYMPILHPLADRKFNWVGWSWSS